ncbi:MAG: glycosyltransferase [Clostridiales Family XIII bacterium]|jgi:glycosyltransferase involved in cell wall biosynthesis|nr:glycosyltransferase [Clostridiales Family XIII bacterium]
MENNSTAARISVIISVYNAKRYLKECVQSVQNQTHTALEIILVDDGSKDGSSALCDAIAEQDERIVVIHKKNGGVSTARNAGLKAATGAYITFVDCDDRIDPDMYETLLALLLEKNADVVVSTFYEERADGSILKTDTGDIAVLNGTEATAAILGNMKDRTTHRMMIWFFVWNKLYKASLLKGIRFDSATDSAEDVPFNLKVFEKAQQIVLLEKPFYFWRKSYVSLSNRHAPDALCGGANTSEIMYSYAKKLPKKYKRAAVTSAFRNLYWYYSFCIAEIYRAGKDGRESDVDAHRVVRRYIREMMSVMRQDSDSKYMTAGYKIAVFFMIHQPRLFSALWLIYRGLKSGK